MTDSAATSFRPNTEAPTVYTVAEAATRARVDEATIRRMVAADCPFPVVRAGATGKMIRIPREAFDAWLAGAA